MLRYIKLLYLFLSFILMLGTAIGQTSISPSTTKVASGGSVCFTATTTCSVSTYCWTGTTTTSVTPGTCSGGGNPAAATAAIASPNVAPGGSCTSPATATAVFPTVTTLTSATVTATSNCGIGATANVTIVPPLGAAIVSPSSQSVVCTAAGTSLSVSVSGGDGTYAYQWYQSANNSTWNLIAGATNATYTPSGLTGGTTTYFHVIVTSFSYTVTSASATVTSTIPALSGGVISNASQAIVTGTAPSTFLCSASNGSSCTAVSYGYLWQKSSDGTNFTSVGDTNQNYSPASIAATTYYRRMTTAPNSSVAYSNVATVTVFPALTPGAISAPSTSVAYGGSASLATVYLPTGGNCSGSYSYQWWLSLDGGTTFTAISGASSTTYTVSGLTATELLYRQAICGSLTSNSDTVTINVLPALQGGTVTPASLSIASGTDTGVLTAGPATSGGCNGSYSYQWQKSTDGVNFSAAPGADTAQTYDPGSLTATTYFRRMVTCASSVAYTNISIITVGAGASSDLNYIRTRTLSKPGVTDTAAVRLLMDPNDVKQVTQYLDGLGRPVQTVAKQQTAAGKDFVSLNVYDPVGREAIQYLPYASASSDGNYKTNSLAEQYTFNTGQYSNEQFYYGQTNFESSPLNRTVNSFPAGASWVGGGRGKSVVYLGNTPLDSVVIWNISLVSGSLPIMAGRYGAGQLFETITSDEQGHASVEYKDKDGRIVLKKVQISDMPSKGHSGWLCTYYIFDDLGNLRFVLQPKAVDSMNISLNWTVSRTVADELCFKYEYDSRNRMMIKKIPGSGEVHMVYDARNRLVLSQDSLMRGQHKWEYFCYDSQNRQDSAGLITDNTNYNNLAYHTAAASSSIGYPVVSGYSSELLTQTFYDDYAGVSAISGLSSGLVSSYLSNGSFFYTTYGSSPIYAAPVSQFLTNRGAVTGSMEKVLGTASQYLYVENFYDDRGRLIQVLDKNFTGAVDTTTIQYNFSGVALRALKNSAKAGNGSQSHYVLKKKGYDANLRLKSNYENIDGASKDQIIDSLQYDELGRLSTKYLGKNIDSLVYTYNIRSWLKSINEKFVTDSSGSYFGLELAYDKIGTLPGTSYQNPQYNGNIAGEIWRSAGDRIAKKYDFYYDDVNRLTGAAYLDYRGSTWSTSFMDYSVSGLKYDANGNILSMTQRGFKMGTPAAVLDSLSYSYMPSSNKLMLVYDAANVDSSTLGDFHYKGSKQILAYVNKVDSDYRYDGNGNLAIDKNKSIDSISYNILNLPQRIHMKGEGLIYYTYDASGNKLQKQTVDSSSGLTTTTLYMGDFQYQRRSVNSSPTSGSDTLQLKGNEEGRARWALHHHLAGDSIYSWEYDFFEKDHLGNTRTVLTQQTDTAQYIATMEAKYRATESALFYNMAPSCLARIAAFGYPNDTSVTKPNDSVIVLNGSYTRQGPAIVLKVMSGDKIDIGVNYFYSSASVTTGQTLNPTYLVNALAAGIVSLSAPGSESMSALTNASGPLMGALNSYLSANNPSSSGKPNAYLNWMLLDDQLNYVGGTNQSGATQVGSAGTTSGGGLQPALTPSSRIQIQKSGFLYVYVSNATPSWNVFFDNLSVKHYSGPMVEENHYYPFGLTMAGISDKALKPGYVNNLYRYNSKELQTSEFKDGSGLDQYDYGARNHDPQIGRWTSIDPLATLNKEWGPYVFSNNNPPRYLDRNGLSSNDVNEAYSSLDVDEQLHVRKVNADGDPGVYMNINGARNLIGYMDPNKKYTLGGIYSYYGKNDYYLRHPIAYWLGIKMVNPNDPNTDKGNDDAVLHEAMGQTIFMLLSDGFGEIFGLGGAAIREINPEEIEEIAEEIIQINKSTEGGGALLNGTPTASLNTALYYSGASEQAASVFRSIIGNHMFVDGNKRTAVLALEAIGKRLGLKLVDQSKLFDVATKVATSALSDISEIAKSIIQK